MKRAPLDPEVYLAHAGHVRALARHLVGDAHQAADVEQQTWLNALQHAPRDHKTLRAWLRAVARNVYHKTWRSEHRRTRLETEAARTLRPVSTPAEILEREATRQRVVVAVLALDEPYRSALTMRFLDELQPHEIAARLDVPVETVRTRIKRGLDRLRTRLQHGGVSAACLIEAFGLARPQTAAALTAAPAFLFEAILMTTTQKFLCMAGVLLAVACALSFWTFAPAPPPEAAAPAVASRAPLTTATAADDAAETLARHLAAANAPDPDPTPSPASGAEGALTVRVEWSDGSAAADIDVFVASVGSAELSARPLRVRTDDDGTFHVPRLAAGLVTVEPDRGGYGSVSVVRDEHARLSVTIPRGFDVEGRAVDADRAPVADAQVYVWYGRHRFYEECVVARTDALGRFRVRSLGHDHATHLGARAAGRAPTRRVVVVGPSGLVRTVTLVFERVGHALAGEIVDGRGVPVSDARVLVGPQECGEHRTEADGTITLAPAGVLVHCDRRGRFEIEGVDAGESEVRVRAPGFAPWSGSITLPGEHAVVVTLARAPSVRGIVRGQDGAAVERALVRTGRTFRFTDALAFTAEDGSFLLRDLEVGEVTLYAAHPSQGEHESRLTTAPGDDVLCDIVLSRGRQILGRVELEGAAAAAAPTAPDGERRSLTGAGWNIGLRPLAGEHAGSLRFAKTDAQGRFGFAGCEQVEHRVFACPPGDAVVAIASRDGVRPGNDEVVLRPDRTLLPSARITGRVVDATGTAIDGASIAPWTPRIVRSEAIVSDAAGRFSVGPLPAGIWSLVIAAPGRVPCKLPRRALTQGETWDVGDVVLATGGRVVAIPRAEPGLVAEPDAVQILSTSTDEVDWLERHDDEWRSGPLAPGRYRIVPVGTGVALAAVQVDVRADAESRADLVLRAGVPFTCRCCDARGRAPAGHVRFSIAEAGGARLLARTVRAEDAVLLLRASLAPGRYRLQATTAELTGAIDVDVEPGSVPATPGELVLRPR